MNSYALDIGYKTDLKLHNGKRITFEGRMKYDEQYKTRI